MKIVLSWFKCKIKTKYNELMNLPDAPENVAGGVAIGAALDFLPIPFISIPISFFVARGVGLNGLAAAITATLLKWAVPFFYALNVMVGRALLQREHGVALACNPHFNIADPHSWLIWLTHLGKPFLLGAAINATLAGIVVFFVFRQFMLRRQKKYQKKQLSKKNNMFIDN